MHAQPSLPFTRIRHDRPLGGGPVTAGSYVPFHEKLPLRSARYHKSAFESVSVES
jgi:hypothetical protein